MMMIWLQPSPAACRADRFGARPRSFTSYMGCRWGPRSSAERKKSKSSGAPCHAGGTPLGCHAGGTPPHPLLRKRTRHLSHTHHCSVRCRRAAMADFAAALATASWSPSAALRVALVLKSGMAASIGSRRQPLESLGTLASHKDRRGRELPQRAITRFSCLLQETYRETESRGVDGKAQTYQEIQREFCSSCGFNRTLLLRKQPP